MLDTKKIQELILKGETPVVEFKFQWYWFDQEPDCNREKPKRWGELIKDIQGLANGYYSYAGQARYLIIGVNENNNELRNVDPRESAILEDLTQLKKKIVEKLEKFLNPAITNLEIYWVSLKKDIRVLAIEIPTPPKLVELKKELMTKTRTIDPGVYLIRKGQKKDEVRFATQEEIKDLEREIYEYHQFQKQVIEGRLSKKGPKERSIDRTVRLYIQKNESYSIASDYPVIKKDWESNIIFEVYKIEQDFGEDKFFVYLHERAAQGKTHNYLMETSLITKSLPLIVLTEKPQDSSPEERKNNIEKIFKTKNVFFVEEFGYQFLYKDYIADYERYDVGVFVESFTDSDAAEERTALQILDDWYTSVSQPLMLIKGYGGIGKTTLTKYFLDSIHEKSEDIGILFIDSNEIINELTRLADIKNKIEDIFDFYEASEKIDGATVKKFSKELLELSIDQGNLVIVLDGMDEVITKLGPRFDARSFLEAIQKNYSSNLERCKIIITCRDYFWDSLDKDIDFTEISLCPFNENMAKDFFMQTFPNLPSKVEKSINLAKRIALKESEDGISVYVPYMLDMVSHLVRSSIEFEDGVNISGIGTKILSPNTISDDYIIGSFCQREVKKLSNFGIDQQIKFFMQLSSNYAGSISVYDIKNLLKEIEPSKYFDDDFIEKLKGHPILNCSGKNQISFRYDFFESYFNLLFLGQFFAKKFFDSDIERIIELVVDYVYFGNSFTQNLCQRITYDDDLVIFSREIIDFLNNKPQSESIRRAKSSIFVLLLSALKTSTSHHYSSAKCTEILKFLFEDEGDDGLVISGAVLIDAYSSDNEKLAFDFRGLTLKNCYFDGYNSFWECEIDKDTRFVDSYFNALENRSNRLKPKVYENTFVRCDTKGIDHILLAAKESVKNDLEALDHDLKKFFELFLKRGNFYPQLQAKIRTKQYSGSLLKVLLRNDVVEDYQDPKKPTMKQYRICSEYKPIVKILEQGGTCIEFERVLRMFSD